jgi:hypothetical protein
MEKVKGVETKQDWKSMQLTYVGHIREVVQGGGGKLSGRGGDPGDARKQQPIG